MAYFGKVAGDASRVARNRVRFVVDVSHDDNGKPTVQWGTLAGVNENVYVKQKLVKVSEEKSLATYAPSGLEITVSVRVSVDNQGVVSIITPGTDPDGP